MLNFPDRHAPNNAFWYLAARGTTLWWGEYAHTKSNHADHPSRECDAPNGSRRSVADGGCPSKFYHAFKSWDSLRKEATMVQK